MAKKKLSRDQKRKQKKQKRGRRQGTRVDPFNKMIGRLQGAGLGDHKFIRNPAGVDKMSDVLKAFIEPYMEFVDDDIEAMRKLTMTALVAWNSALMTPRERQEGIQAVSKALPADAVEDFEAIVAEMIERKNTYFANYTRHILDCEVTDLGDSFHISVVSTLGAENDLAR